MRALDKLADKCGLKIYNLGTGNGYSVLDIVKAFSAASGREVNFYGVFMIVREEKRDCDLVGKFL